MNTTGHEEPHLDASSFKACCAAAYESLLLNYFVGPAWRPGGVAVTEEMAHRLGVDSASLVLDLASGGGETARLLVSRFACAAVGLDLSTANLRFALGQPVALPDKSCPPSFVAGDAESLPFATDSFDAVFCECSLCIFADKKATLSEILRVLRPGGRFALADVTLEVDSLSISLQGMWSRVACLADALPAGEYRRLLEDSGFVIESVQDCRQEAKDFLKSIDQRLFLARIGQALGKFGLENINIKEARALLSEAIGLVDAGRLSYAYFVARSGV